MADPARAFEAARRAELANYNELTADALLAIIAALEEARIAILKQLAGAPTLWQQSYYKRLLPQINASMARFKARGTGVWADGLTAVWQAGADLVEKPLIAAGQLVTGQLQRVNDRVLLQQRVFLIDKIKDITTEARNKIEAQLQLSLTGVQSNAQTIAAINGILGGATRQRAITITRTELGRAHAAATQLQMEQAAKKVPGLQKQWRRSRKLYSRVAHDAADGQVRDVEDTFLIGGVAMLYPRDPNAPASQTVNCGCVALPYKKDWKSMANPDKFPKPKAE